MKASRTRLPSAVFTGMALRQLLQHPFVVLGTPLGVFLVTGRPSLLNRISPICLGEPRLKGWSCDVVRILCAKSVDERFFIFRTGRMSCTEYR
jgi:hypothetical protein